jgi:hypothetical protein
MVVIIAFRFTRVMAIATRLCDMLLLRSYNWPPYD